MNTLDKPIRMPSSNLQRSTTICYGLRRSTTIYDDLLRSTTICYDLLRSLTSTSSTFQNLRSEYRQYTTEQICYATVLYKLPHPHDSMYTTHCCYSAAAVIRWCLSSFMAWWTFLQSAHSRCSQSLHQKAPTCCLLHNSHSCFSSAAATKHSHTRRKYILLAISVRKEQPLSI